MDLKSGESRVLQTNGEEVAVFNVEGCLFALGNKCPHRGGPLSRGRLEKIPSPFGEGEGRGEGAWAVRCPIHGWLFDLGTGRCLNQPEAKICAYSVTSQNGEVSLSPLA